MTLKISAMTAGTTPAGTEPLASVQGGNTRSLTVSQIALLSKTLAQLNTQVSDATLIDTGDSRLSDARTPSSHGLGGSEHATATLAQLTAKVSDATLARTDAGQTFTGAQTFASILLGANTLSDSLLAADGLSTSDLALVTAGYLDALYMAIGDAPTAHDLDAHGVNTLAELSAIVSDATLARTDATQTFTGSQQTNVTTLIDGASIAIDAAANNAFKVTLGGARTLANPTNVVEGMSWTVRIIQDGTGSRALTMGANYDWGDDNTAVDTSADAATKERLLSFYAVSATKIIVVDAVGVY